MVIQRAGEWERRKVLSAAGDQQALRDLCPFLLNERQRFMSLSTGAEKLALYFLSRLWVGYAFPNWIVCPFPSFRKIYFGAIQPQSNHTFTSPSVPVYCLSFCSSSVHIWYVEAFAFFDIFVFLSWYDKYCRNIELANLTHAQFAETCYADILFGWLPFSAALTEPLYWLFCPMQSFTAASQWREWMEAFAHLWLSFFFHTFSQDLIFSVPHSYQASCTTLSACDVLTATVEMTAPACPPL